METTFAFQSTTRVGILSLIVVILLVILIGLYTLQRQTLFSESRVVEELDIPVVIPPAGQMTLYGEYVCLPAKNSLPGEAQDANCQLGIRADDGYYYSLDFNVMNPALELGDRFGVTGQFTPLEALSSTFLRDTYDVRGIIFVEGLDVE